VTSHELLAGIRDANYHRGGIRCMRLFQVESGFLDRLVNEATQLCAVESASQADRPGHVTRWAGPYGRVRQYSLLNRSGQYDDFSTDHDLSCFGKRFRAGSRYPSLAQFVGAFAHAVNFRIHAMDPGSGLSTHEEHTVIRARDGRVGIRARFHLPLVTNPAAEVTLDGRVYHLEQGAIFFVNNGCIHSARNGGGEVRIHLVWDLLLTRDMLELMFGDRPFEGLALQRVPTREQTPSSLAAARVEHVRTFPAPVPENEAVAPVLMTPQ
jgi:hypothetical protein